MHVGSDIRNTVAFIGYEDSTAPGGIRCIGTGVLVGYKGAGYLVTARHVVEPIGDAPFLIRVNRRDGGANAMRGENVKWHYHPDEIVDLAAISFYATQEKGFDCLFIAERDVLSDVTAASESIDIGDFCYTLGLFRYMSGNERNEPVLFTGHVALWNGKQFPIWNRYKKKRELVDGHLVQSLGLQGASGSPVFVRPAFKLTDLPLTGQANKKTNMTAAVDKLFLMGIMQGAWFLPPDELLRAEIGASTTDTVPVGLGIVTPSSRILELLENTPEFVSMREKQQPPDAASMTVVPPVKVVPPASDVNPNHREDFKRLLGEAARKPEPRD